MAEEANLMFLVRKSEDIIVLIEKPNDVILNLEKETWSCYDVNPEKPHFTQLIGEARTKGDLSRGTLGVYDISDVGQQIRYFSDLRELLSAQK